MKPYQTAVHQTENKLHKFDLSIKRTLQVMITSCGVIVRCASLHSKKQSRRFISCNNYWASETHPITQKSCASTLYKTERSLSRTEWKQEAGSHAGSEVDKSLDGFGTLCWGGQLHHDSWTRPRHDLRITLTNAKPTPSFSVSLSLRAVFIPTRLRSWLKPFFKTF